MKRALANVLELPLEVRAEMALQDAIDGVIEKHIREGLPIYIWRDGKVVELSPEELRTIRRCESG